MNINYGKLDPALSGVLSEMTQEPAEMLTVSVRTVRPLTAQQQAEFELLGGKGVESKLGIYSAIVDRSRLVALSNKPWVKLLSLARRLKMS
jgi:hypothetical protein